jgi:hypothetical protein
LVRHILQGGLSADFRAGAVDARFRKSNEDSAEYPGWAATGERDPVKLRIVALVDLQVSAA